MDSETRLGTDPSERRHPEPGTSFSYSDWKQGKAGNPVAFKQDPHSKICSAQVPLPDHQSYSEKLEQTSREQGLQVVVSAWGLNLTPECPIL